MNPEKNRRILVIDDNKSIHDDFRKILSPYDSTRTALNAAEMALFGSPADEEQETQFEIESAYQGQEGVALVKKALEAMRPYAVVFVDMRMPPGWDGLKTAQEIGEADPEIQIVICTAYSAYSSDEISERVGNSDRMSILNKPFNTVETLRLAHELTERWHWIHFCTEKKPAQSAGK